MLKFSSTVLLSPYCIWWILIMLLLVVKYNGESLLIDTLLASSLSFWLVDYRQTWLSSKLEVRDISRCQQWLTVSQPTGNIDQKFTELWTCGTRSMQDRPADRQTAHHNNHYRTEGRVILCWHSCYPRKSEGLCFYRRWFVCLSVCLSVCLFVCYHDN